MQYREVSLSGYSFFEAGNIRCECYIDGLIITRDLERGIFIELSGDHKGTVLCDISPDGQFIAINSDNNTIQIFDRITGFSVGLFSGHTAQVTRISFSPDEETLISSSLDGTIRFWNIATSDEMFSISTNNGGVTDFALTEGGTSLISGSDNGTITAWNVASCKMVHKVTCNSGAITAIGSLTRENIYASASNDGTVNLWTGPYPKHLKTIHCDEIPVRSLIFSQLSMLLAILSSDGSIKVFDTITGALIFWNNLPGKPDIILNKTYKRVITRQLKYYKARKYEILSSPGVNFTALPDALTDSALTRKRDYSIFIDNKPEVRERKPALIRDNGIESEFPDLSECTSLKEEICINKVRENTLFPEIANGSSTHLSTLFPNNQIESSLFEDNAVFPGLNSSVFIRQLPGTEKNRIILTEVARGTPIVNFEYKINQIGSGNSIIDSDVLNLDQLTGPIISIPEIRYNIGPDLIAYKNEILTYICKKKEIIEDIRISPPRLYTFNLFVTPLIRTDLSNRHVNVKFETEQINSPGFETLEIEDTRIALGLIEPDEFNNSLILIHGNPISGLAVSASIRFFQKLPTLLIPLAKDEMISSWNLSITCTTDKTSYSVFDSLYLEKYLNIERDIGYASLELESLLKDSSSDVAQYTLKVKKGRKQSIEQSITFFVVPGLSIQIKPDLLGPLSKDDESHNLIIDFIGPDQVIPKGEVISEGRLRYDLNIDAGNFLQFLEQEITLIYLKVGSNGITQIPITLIPPIISYSIRLKNEDTPLKNADRKFVKENIPRDLLAVSDYLVKIMVYFLMSGKKPYSFVVERNGDIIEEIPSNGNEIETFVIDLKKYVGFLNEPGVEYSFSLYFNGRKNLNRILLVTIPGE